MHRQLFFVLATILVILTSCGKKTNKNLDLTPRIELESKELSNTFGEKDKTFFLNWSEGRMYQGFILDIANAKGKKDVYQHAEKRFKQFSKEKRYKYNKQSLRYILYCPDSQEVVVLMNKGAYNIINSVFPGKMYSLSCKKYQSVSSVVKQLAKLSHDATAEYQTYGWIKKNGVHNDLLGAVDLALDSIFIPSDNFFFRFIFALPFGASMACLKVFNSIYAAAVYFLLLFIICQMASLRRLTVTKNSLVGAFLLWGLSIFAFMSFCCLINSIEPSVEFRNGLLNHGYSKVFESHYAEAYLNYRSANTPIFAAIVIIIFYTVDALLSWGIKASKKKESDTVIENDDDPLGGLAAVTFGALACNSSLGYIVMAYLLFRIIRSLYSLFAPLIVENKTRELSAKPIWILGILVMIMYFLIPTAMDSSSIIGSVKNAAISMVFLLSISGSYLFVILAINLKSSFKEIVAAFIVITTPIKWNLGNYISYNMLFAVSALSPLVILLNVIYSLSAPRLAFIIDIAIISIILTITIVVISVSLSGDKKIKDSKNFVDFTWNNLAAYPLSADITLENVSDIAINRAAIGIASFGFFAILVTLISILIGYLCHAPIML